MLTTGDAVRERPAWLWGASKAGHAYQGESRKAAVIPASWDTASPRHTWDEQVFLADSMAGIG
jgi:hypothetical protein